MLQQGKVLYMGADLLAFALLNTEVPYLRAAAPLSGEKR